MNFNHESNINPYQVQQRDEDLSINVSSGPLGYSNEVDMHNRCCSGRFWCIQDICGIICAILTWFLILYAMFVTIFVILIPTIGNHTFFSAFNILLFLTLSVLAFVSHVRTMLTDPVSFVIQYQHNLMTPSNEYFFLLGGCSARKCN